MNKLNFKAALILLAGFCVAFGCKRSESVTPGGQQKPATLQIAERSASHEPKVTYSWLNFASLNDFTEAMKELQERCSGPRELKQWEKPFNYEGFTSLRGFYEQNDADTSENRKELTTDSLVKLGKILDCPDSWFATMLSKDGNIQIGDTVYCFRPGKNGGAYAIPDREAPAIAQGKPLGLLGGGIFHGSIFDNPIIPIPEWPSGTILKKPTGEPICKYPSGLMPQWWGKVGGNILRDDNNVPFPEHNGRPVKLVYQRWRVGFIFYASAGARIKMMKDTRFAGWQSVTYADQMIMEACAKGKVHVPGLPLFSWDSQTSPAWPDFTRFAENNFEKVMKWTASGFFNEIILEHFNLHFKVIYRGHVSEWEIRQ